MIETKEYQDGMIATGVAPLPELSPRQQDGIDPHQCLDDIEAIMGGSNGPSLKLRAFIHDAQREIKWLNEGIALSKRAVEIAEAKVPNATEFSGRG